MGVNPEAISGLTVGGPAAALVLVILYLLRQNFADRRQYRDDVARLESRHNVAIAEFKTEVTSLRAEIKGALDLLETERKARWNAEDEAAHWRREAELLRPPGGTS